MQATLVSEQEYLTSTWHPDREFANGDVIERNVGTPKHSRLQLLIAALLMRQEDAHGFRTFTEARVRLGPEQYRIPDVCAVPIPVADLRYLADPILVIEVVSPDDTFTEVIAKGRLYRSCGIQHVWILDPEQKRAFSLDEHSSLASVESAEFQAAGYPPAAVSFEELFAHL